VEEYAQAYRYLKQQERHDYSAVTREWGLTDVQNDGAATGVSIIAKQGRDHWHRRVYLSGAGGDEIMTEYGFNGTKLSPVSTFGGVFPDNLTTLFPWPSFFAGSQRDFLMKEEIAAGTRGVETRYPFLDPYLVQEYLWLSSSVKNAVYKHPVHNFFTKHSYPFLPSNKKGFAAGMKLRLQKADCKFSAEKEEETMIEAQRIKSRLVAHLFAPDFQRLFDCHGPLVEQGKGELEAILIHSLWNLPETSSSSSSLETFPLSQYSRGLLEQ